MTKIESRSFVNSPWENDGGMATRRRMAFGQEVQAIVNSEKGVN